MLGTGPARLVERPLPPPFPRPHPPLPDLPTSTYFPADKHAQADWYRNMAAQFPSVSAALGFAAADTAAWVADGTAAAFALDALGTPVANFAQAVTGYVNTLVNGPADSQLAMPAAPVWPPADLPAAVTPGIDGRRQKTVARIKAAPGYTPDVIGVLLRTEATGTPVNVQSAAGLIRNLHLDTQGRVVGAFGKLGGAIEGGEPLHAARGRPDARGEGGQLHAHPGGGPDPAQGRRGARDAGVHGDERRQRRGGRHAQPGVDDPGELARRGGRSGGWLIDSTGASVVASGRFRADGARFFLAEEGAKKSDRSSY